MKNIFLGLLYALTFIVIFALSSFLTLKWQSSASGLDEVYWDETVGKVYQDLQYGNGKYNKFDLYVPVDASQKKYKLILYIHGGGFTGGDKADDAAIAKYFTAKGFVTATINYTFSSANYTSDVQKMSLEILSAVEPIKKKCEVLGYPLDAMAVSGVSSGGCLAMIYAYRDYKLSPLPVKCVMQQVGPTSFDPAHWFGYKAGYKSEKEAKEAAGFVSTVTGFKISTEMMRSGKFRDYIRPISPCMLVDSTTVPTLSAYGPYDKIVPYRLTQPLFQALDHNNVIHDNIIFPNSGHALHRDRKQTRLYYKKMDEYLEKYLIGSK